MIEAIAASWGLAGIIILLVSAIYRMTPPVFEAFKYNFLWYHWLLLILNILFMVLVKGYIGFHKKFSPRAAARAKYLKGHPVSLNSILNPLFCMGYLGSTRKRKLASISLTTFIIMAIIFIRRIAQPWRGIIDFGVVAGLSCGILSLITMGYKAFFGDDFNCPDEVVGKTTR